ncbi:hypothetical protein WDU94_014036, partial [Cyamophila willieti]
KCKKQVGQISVDYNTFLIYRFPYPINKESIVIGKKFDLPVFFHISRRIIASGHQKIGFLGQWFVCRSVCLSVGL